MRQRRVWFAAGLAVAAVVTTIGDGRPAWTGLVALGTGTLAVLTAWLAWGDAHPGWAERRQEEQVAKILWRYERQAAARERAKVEADDGDSLGSRGTE